MMLLRVKHISYILLLATLLVTTYLHLWRLEDFPPAISGDEADNGLEVILLMAEPQLIAFAPSNAGREALFHYLLMLPISIFGPTAFALRIIPALAGIIIVPLSYRWVRELLPASPSRTWIALLTAMFTATSPWLLQISRLGLRGILLIPCMLAAYFFFWRGYSRKQYRWFVWSGIFLGLAVNTYTASRSLPLAFIGLVVVISLFYWRQTSDRLGLMWRGLVITGLTSLVVFAPLGWYFLNNPGAFIYRSGQVTLWSTYQMFHAHTGQSFSQFLFKTWLDNLIWFGQISSPWRQSADLPSLVSWLPILVAVGGLIALWQARRHIGYIFLVITFFLGILPIFIGQPTTMRVILAAPAAYALFAIGLYVPISFLVRRVKRGDLALNISMAMVVMIFSTVSTLTLFQPQNWIGLPPLPTEWDFVIDEATKQAQTLVVEEQQSLLVPQAVFNFPTAQFLLQANFASPLPVEDQTRLAPTEKISIFWPVEWERWFGSESPSFTLLSPGTEGQGYVETIGQWELSKVGELESLVQAQQTSGEATTVVDDTGRLIAHIIAADRAQVLASLRSEPQYPVYLNFQDEIMLLGYDAHFLPDQTLDIGLFWQAQRNILEDHNLLLQLVNRHDQVMAEKFSQFDAPTAGWFPGQLIIDHQLLQPMPELSQDIYVLKAGLLKINYKTPIRSEYGEWITNVSRVDQPLSLPFVPLGQLTIGELPSIKQEVNVNFADQIRLTGYWLIRSEATGQFQILLNWQASQPIEQDYTVTIQLFDQHQSIVAQIDRPPLGGAYPTSTWPLETPIIDIYDLELPSSLTTGPYQLAIGLYDFETLQRLPVNTDDAPVLTDLAVVEQVNLY